MELPTEIQRLDQFANVIVMCRQQSQLEKSTDQRKSSARILIAWPKLRANFSPVHKEHMYLPNCAFYQPSWAFPMTGMNSAHLFCTCCWGATLGAGHFKFKFLLNNESSQTETAFLFFIHVLKIICLEVVEVALVDAETRHVECLAKSKQLRIFSSSWGRVTRPGPGHTLRARQTDKNRGMLGRAWSIL